MPLKLQVCLKHVESFSKETLSQDFFTKTLFIITVSYAIVRGMVVNTKSLLSVFFIAVIFSGLVLVSTVRFSVVEASTDVNGLISSDTTWTLSNSPYLFAGDVTVDRGVTLTIESGVAVDFTCYSLIVEGTLNARGTESSRIKLESSEKIVGAWPPRIFFTVNSTWWDETTGSGCIIEYAEVSIMNYQYETIRDGFPKISNNIFYNYGNDAAAICLLGGEISNNTILGGYRGIGISGSGGLIIHNTIKETESGSGISIGTGEAPTVIGNLLMDNQAGISFWGPNQAQIYNNTLVENTMGFRFTQYISTSELGAITYNNVYNNDHDVMVEKEDSQITIQMAYNWWGTTDASVIDQKIHDQKDNSVLSLVNYEPLLTTPADSPDTTDYIPLTTPSPTPTPEQTPNQTVAPVATPTPSAIPVPGQSYFYVESNSNVSDLFFNSTSGELRFTVTGESGTAGYVEVTIAKSLVSSIQDARVYLDGSQLEVAITENGDSWLLHFTYTHSTHQVTVAFGPAVFDIRQIGQALVIFLPLVAVVLFFAVTKLRNRKSKSDKE